MQNHILIEAESFSDVGGWVVDPQFMDEMGSPFLLAHGLGQPVADATTTVTIPKSAEYRVWVRTRDWVGPWKSADTPDTLRADGCPGAFQVLFDDQPLAVTFGVEGADWHWQDGGVVRLQEKTTAVTLHDLTGFEGRCDAILLSDDLKWIPPSDVNEMNELRQRLPGFPEQPRNAGSFDLAVVGGGIGGICAAVSAARNGLRVAFIQDRPVVGGNNNSEVRVWLGGATNGERYPRIGDIVKALDQETREHYGPKNTAKIYEDEKKLALLEAEANISRFLGYRGNGVECEDDRIKAVIAQDVVTGERLRFAARWVADCTGDGCIGFLVGADYEMTRSGHMGRCNLWNVVDAGTPQSFPRCPWALDLKNAPFPGRGEHAGQYADKGLGSLGCWFWESGFDHDPIKEREAIRDWNFRAMYGAWDCLKNEDGVYPNHKLNWAAYISGPRESRRLLGPVVVTDKDLLENRQWEDGCVVTGWTIDVHVPHEKYLKGFEGDAFISKAHHTDFPTHWLPYRMLYSRNVPNLFMAGRNVSVTHEALGTARIMRTGGLMGEVIGLAAALCKKHNSDPNSVYEDHFDEFKALITRGVNPIS